MYIYAPPKYFASKYFSLRTRGNAAHLNIAQLIGTKTGDVKYIDVFKNCVAPTHIATVLAQDHYASDDILSRVADLTTFHRATMLF